MLIVYVTHACVAYAVLGLATIALVLLQWLLAAYTECAWSARDYAGTMTPAQEGWLWPPGQYGEAPFQQPPPRMQCDVGTRRMAMASLGSAAPHLSSATTGAGSLTTPVSTRGRAGRSTATATASGSRTASPLAPASGVRTPAPAPAPAPGSASGSAMMSPPAPRVLHRPPEAQEESQAAGLMQPVPRRYPDSASALSNKRPLRIVILTVGTRGDVQPYVALGQVKLILTCCFTTRSPTPMFLRADVPRGGAFGCHLHQHRIQGVCGELSIGVW
jgi:hypothetical protein